VFLKKFSVPSPIRVGFLSGESGLATIKETLRRICVAKITELADIGDRLLVSDWLPRFDNAKHMDALERWIETSGLEVVMIDPAYLCVPGEVASNLFLMGQTLRSVSDVFDRTGATLVLLHHARKNGGVGVNPYAPPELDGLSSAGFAEWARQWLLLKRRQAYMPGTGEHRLWLSVGGSAGHSGLWAVDIDEGACDPRTPRTWTVKVSKPEDLRHEREELRESRKAEGLQRNVDKVLSALAKLPDGGTVNTIKNATGLKTPQAKAAVEAALADERLLPAKVVAKNRQKYDGYKLAKPSATDRHPGHSGSPIRDGLPD
jgi:hypothetical protein